MAVTASGAAQTAPSTRVVDFDVRLAHPVMAAAVQEVLQGAFDRLGRERCQAVFADFAGLSGRPLQEEIDRRGLTGQDCLRRVIFRDGTAHRHCESRRVMAVTSPGSQTVYICTGTFWKWFRRNRLEVEATLIHEALHTLGLREDPPSSREITAHVIRRCRR
jgi:hypothetical protein